MIPKTYLIVLFLCAALWATDGTIEIDVTVPGPRINPQMYGIFLEEINHGVDGGLYAELIRNRHNRRKCRGLRRSLRLTRSRRRRLFVVWTQRARNGRRLRLRVKRASRQTLQVLHWHPASGRLTEWGRVRGSDL